VARKQESNTPIKKSQPEVPEELQEIEEELISHNPDIFTGINAKKKAEILKSVFTVTIQQKSHSGPLPDPESLISYNSVIPDGANRIMTMAEKQQDHRMAMEMMVVGSHNFQSKLGQIFGLIIGLFGIACGTFLAFNGHTTVGGIVAGGTVISLVSVFVLGKKTQNKE